MWDSILVSTLAGLATGVGALLVVLFGRPTKRFLSGMLGLAGGLMLAISVFDLIPEAAELGTQTTTIIGLVLGAGIMALLDIALPHLHSDLQAPDAGLGGQADDLQACPLAQGNNPGSGQQVGLGRGQGGPGRGKGRGTGFGPGQMQNMMHCGILLAIGIALHNLPEGLAIGAGYISSSGLGTTIAISLALHNIPEGMITAAPLLLAGMNKWVVIAIAAGAGLMTPIGTIIGLSLANVSTEFISVAMALAAGAMIYIVSDELIPQSHANHSHTANIGLVAGFILGYMM